MVPKKIVASLVSRGSSTTKSHFHDCRLNLCVQFLIQQTYKKTFEHFIFTKFPNRTSSYFHASKHTACEPAEQLTPNDSLLPIGLQKDVKSRVT